MSRPRRGDDEPEVSIHLCPDGPLLVHGDVELVGEEGQPIGSRSPMVLCRCGRSGSKPFCDGTHKVGRQTP